MSLRANSLLAGHRSFYLQRGKRLTDIVFSLVGIMVLLPVLVIIGTLVKCSSRGPVLFRQQRVGKDGRLFWILKFRSMCADADGRLASLRDQNEASGPLFKMRRDPRITRVGSVLRRWSIDELPQLLNVLR